MKRKYAVFQDVDEKIDDKDKGEIKERETEESEARQEFRNCWEDKERGRREMKPWKPKKKKPQTTEVLKVIGKVKRAPPFETKGCKTFAEERTKN